MATRRGKASFTEWKILENKIKALEDRCRSRKTKTIFNDLRGFAATKADSSPKLVSTVIYQIDEDTTYLDDYDDNDDSLSTIGLSGGSDSSMSHDHGIDEDLKCLLSYTNNKRHIGMEELLKRGQKQYHRQQHRRDDYKIVEKKNRHRRHQRYPSISSVNGLVSSIDAATTFSTDDSVVTDVTRPIDNRNKK